MTSDKKKIPINNHHAAPHGARAEDRATGTSGAAAASVPDSASSASFNTDPPAFGSGVAPSPGADRTHQGRQAAADRGAAPGESAAAVDDAAGLPGDAGDGAAAQGRNEVPPEPTPLEAVTAERDGYLDALRRLQAEFDNYRRRSQRESTEVRARARSGLLAEFLPVFDNLARALDAAEHHEEGKVLAGVHLTHSLFADLLRREGVEEIHPLGCAFDPNLHEAIASLPSDEEEGTVISVADKGYTAGEAVLRPARVVVSAGPSAGPAEE